MLENAFLSLSLSNIPHVVLNAALKEPRIPGIPRRLVAILSIGRFLEKEGYCLEILSQYSRFLLRSEIKVEIKLALSMQSCAARAVPTAVVDRLDHLTAVMWSFTQQVS